MIVGAEPRRRQSGRGRPRRRVRRARRRSSATRTASPYERPPLSKAVLRGEADPTTTLVHDAASTPPTTSSRRRPRRRPPSTPPPAHVRARRRRRRRRSTTAVLATGAAPRRLDVPGADLDGVHYLRNARRLGSPRATPSARRGRVAVVGAGWIGSEVAASARQMGAEVVLIDPGPVPLQRVLGDEIGDVFAASTPTTASTCASAPASPSCAAPSTVEQVVLDDGASRPPTSSSSASVSSPGSSSPSPAGLRVDNGDRRRRAPRDQRPRRVRRGRRRQRLAPPLRPAPAGRALGQRPQPGPHRRSATPPAAASPTPGCPTSSPTSTTSAWSTSATAEPGDDRRGPRRPRATASSSPSGTATASSPRP